MKPEQLRRAAALLESRDDLAAWLAVIVKDHEVMKYPMIRFDDIGRYNPKSGEGSGWSGNLTVTRDVAEVMLKSAIAYIDAALKEAGAELA